MNPATEFDTCPRCGSFELIVGEDGSGCLVCGFVRDDEGDLPLPHYSLRYMFTDSDANMVDIKEAHGSFPINNLGAAEAWLKARKAEGYIITSCVLVNEHGHVIWLRGNPGEWNWEGKN